VRRSAEKYQAACVACERSKQALVDIEYEISGSASASFSADKQESLNRANDEVLVMDNNASHFTSHTFIM